MSIAGVLIPVCISGIFGGLVDGVVLLVDGDKDPSTGSFKVLGRVSLNLYLLARGAMGLGGAVSVLMLEIWVGKFKLDNYSTGEQIFQWCLAFVAGFIGYRLLPKVGAGLQSLIEKSVQEQTQQVRTEASQISQEAIRYSKLTSQVMAAFSDLGRLQPNLAALQADIAELEPAKKDWPRDRKLFIVLGRLYRKVGNLDQAIAVLTEFLNNKKNAGQASDRDYGDAIFNRACYYSLKSAKAAGNEAADLKKLAYADLVESVKASPDNRFQMMDDDLASLRDDPAYKDQVLTLGQPEAPKP